ncbi:restriction endonuclease subunit S [Gaetbulibacter jejuensis]|uniref:Restriction endonuclease subunit S n=1 Tax=Gaetbulibacter jejuensis TaxID=584607 RepID=A0ABP3V599_9FLAO
MPNNWKTYKLGDIAENVSRRFDFDKYEKAVFINTGDVLEGKFLHNEIKDGDGLPGQAKKAIQKGDILFSEIRPKNKRYALVDFEANNYVVSTKFMVIVSDNLKVDEKYFLQLLTSNQKLAELQMIAEGRSGTFPQITFDAISHIEFNLPPLPEQKAIANILSAIDDKIENNLAINKTLEDMAMALYKHWFVDFGPFQDGEFIDSELGPIPKGWEVRKIKDFVNHQKGFAFKSKWYQEKGKLVVRVSDTTHNSINVESCNKISYELASKHDDYSLDVDDVIIATVGSWPPNYSSVVGKVVRVPITAEGGLLNQNAVRLKMNIANEKYQSLLYCILKDNRFLNYIVNSAQGSASQASIKLVDIFNYSIPFGGRKIIKEFSSLIASKFAQQNAIALENQSLTQLRDTLLPKLISGEVRLKEFKEQIESVIVSKERTTQKKTSLRT